MATLEIRLDSTADRNKLRRLCADANHGLSPNFWRASYDLGQILDHFCNERMQSKIYDPDQSFENAEVAAEILTYQITVATDVDVQASMMRSLLEVGIAPLGSVFVNALATQTIRTA